MNVLPEVPAILIRYGIAAAAPVHPLPGGHINASYRVEALRPGSESAYLLQRLNPAVFPDPTAVMSNLSLVTGHLAQRVVTEGLPEPERRVLRLVPASDGRSAVVAADGAWWRLFRFIPGTVTLERAATPEAVSRVAHAFGLFHRLMMDYAGPPLQQTIPGFHDTPARLAALAGAAAADPLGRRAGAAAELARIERMAGLAGALAARELPGRIAHNDAKPANVLCDARTGVDLAVVDLDTVMPGTLLNDVGDLLRSLASDTAEDAPDAGAVRVDPERVLAVAEGFGDGLGPVPLAAAEAEGFLLAGSVICLEQAARFLADHLSGDTYYRTSRPGQNLDRARVQLALVDGLEAVRPGLRAEVARRFDR